MKMKTTEEAIVTMIEAYGTRTEWMRISEMADLTGLTRDELGAAIETLIMDDDFHADSDALRMRVSRRERELAPVIDDEPRHLIKWT